MKTYRNFLNEGLKTARETFLKDNEDLTVFNVKLLSLDHTTTKKYMDYIVKQYLINNDIDLKELKHYVTEFDRHYKSFDNPVYFDEKELDKKQYMNINFKKYDDYEFLKKVIDHKTETKSSEIKKSKKSFKNKEKVIFEDDRFIIANPESHQESCTYSQGAKWCISMKKNDTHWESYTNKNDINFYFIRDKKHEIGKQYSNIAVAVYPDHMWDKRKERGKTPYEAYDYNDKIIPNFEKYAKDNGLNMEIFKPLNLDNLSFDKKIDKGIELSFDELKSIDLINEKSIIFKIRKLLIDRPNTSPYILYDCVDDDFKYEKIEFDTRQIEITMTEEEYYEKYSKYVKEVIDYLENLSSPYFDNYDNDLENDLYNINDDNKKLIDKLMKMLGHTYEKQEYVDYEYVVQFAKKYKLNDLFSDFQSELTEGRANAKSVWANEKMGKIPFDFEEDFYNSEGYLKLPYKKLFNLLYKNKAFNMTKLSEMMKLNLNSRDEDLDVDDLYDEESQMEDIAEQYYSSANEKLKIDLENFIENLAPEKIVFYEKFNKLLKDLKFKNNKLEIKDRTIRIKNIDYENEKIIVIEDEGGSNDFQIPFDELVNYVQQYRLKLEHIKKFKDYTKIRN